LRAQRHPDSIDAQDCEVAMGNEHSKATDIPKTNRALTYARVSSKEQDTEGYSIAAQQKLLLGYATERRLVIEKEFIDVETAKASGRASFTEMVAYLKKHPGVRIVLVEKTDRLYRNLKDWVLLDELEIEIHLVKEGVVLSKDSRSSEKFFHGIKVLMAKNYIDNLSEEARKGQLEKASQGLWPTKAPLGYRNAAGGDGKRIITPDPDVAPIVSKMFEWYVDGTLSLEKLADKAHSAGLSYRRTGTPVPTSAVHAVLRNRIYTGEFLWKGKTYKGRHTPLISVELFERVQDVLQGRHRKKLRRVKNDFAFSSLIHCGHCGCALTGDIKKGRYVYYRCTGYKGRCPEPYVKEEALSEKFSELLRQLDIGETAFKLVSDGLRSSHVDQAKEHNEAIARLQAEYERIQARLHAMYIDKLDGKIDSAMFESLSATSRKQQDRCLREIERYQAADQSYLEEGITILEMARDARRLFEQRQAMDKRRLLNFVVSNSTWANGELRATFREPFGFITKMAKFVSESGAPNGGNFAEHSAWLGN
jgi:site-specific DNA recombinase